MQYIHEQLLGLKFRISPDSFFQVNTRATEVLYSVVGEMCSGAGRPVVYGMPAYVLLLLMSERHTAYSSFFEDICCGTGTIGLCLAKVRGGMACTFFIIFPFLPSATGSSSSSCILTSLSLSLHSARMFCG